MIRSKVGIPLITTTTTELWATESNGELNGSTSSAQKVSPKKVIVLGGDGFCGWPTSLHLSDQGHDVVVVDNLSRRNIDIELGCDSLTPIQSPEVGLFFDFCEDVFFFDTRYIFDCDTDLPKTFHNITTS
jgi:hypothetical protein